ncbi:MAG: hypothetical protein IPM24_21465 [Bryobacterales bacterium]|nr:hypothetical protein [Bryobacterales bacterium]
MRIISVSVLLAAPLLFAQEAAKPVAGFPEGPRRNAVTPGEFLIDPPTLESLGFRWYIQGDSNRNAAVAVAYRAKGDPAWKDAQPLLRVHHEIVNQQFSPYRTGNLFAGSVLFLRPGTGYEVRLTMTDPDGGAPPPKIINVTTRTEPRTPAGGRTISVSPGRRDFRAAYAEAQPGDTLLFDTGVYRVLDTMRLTKPRIAFRAVRPGAVIEGAGYRTDLFDISQADHLTFEGLTFRSARTALLAGTKNGAGASHLTVRNCRIEDVIYGINSTSERSEGWYIADNVILGTNPAWHPRPQAYMSPAHTGVNVYGRGHVVRRNRISRFSDSLAIANFGFLPEDIRMHPVAIDFTDNDLDWAQDDCLETDYGAHNIRVLRNRCANAHTALSVQPFYGGPVYLIRNELYAVTLLAFKIHNYSSGIIAYHNTSATSATGFQSFDRWQNGHFRNNLILGGSGVPRPDGQPRHRYAMSTGSMTPYTTLDYNGYRRNAPGALIRWFDGKKHAEYDTLEAFHKATGHEAHGRMVDYDIFVDAVAPRAGTTMHPDQYDLRLRPGSAAVDAGMPLANINDGFAGRAPDMGAYELGVPPPVYGPLSQPGGNQP